jgi:hypothetical protein
VHHSCLRVAATPTLRARSLRQAAKASVLHTDTPRFESWSEHHRSVCRALSRSAGAPRPRASLAPRECPAGGGEPIRNSRRSSPVAQRQSARPITGRPRFDTVRENHAPIAHARLAQPAERRPLKSEVRGSSPRSCTNSATIGRLRWSGRHPVLKTGGHRKVWRSNRQPSANSRTRQQP